MVNRTACCGLDCATCPAFLATTRDDDAARAETAAFYRREYGFSVKPEEINCDGCLTEGGRLFVYCQKCDIRTCCRAKQIENCAFCPEQPCDGLAGLHQFSAKAREDFEKLLGRVR